MHKKQDVKVVVCSMLLRSKFKYVLIRFYVYITRHCLSTCQWNVVLIKKTFRFVIFLVTYLLPTLKYK